MKSCPHCDHDYSPTDGLTVKRVPMGRKIENLVYPVTMWWSAILVTTVVYFAIFQPMDKFPMPGRAMGWGIMYAPLIPGGILTIISWFFPHVRIYHCRHCGIETELPLKTDHH
jgi:TRAP-type C4-dicarboxylate transport system permease small subunit